MKYWNIHKSKAVCGKIENKLEHKQKNATKLRKETQIETNWIQTTAEQFTNLYTLVLVNECVYVFVISRLCLFHMKYDNCTDISIQLNSI